MAGTISGTIFPNNASVTVTNMRQNPNWDPNKIVIPGYEQANNPSQHQDSVTISPEARGENKGQQKTQEEPTNWQKIQNFFRNR